MDKDTVILYGMTYHGTGCACLAKRTEKLYIVKGEAPGLRFGYPFFRGRRIQRATVESQTPTTNSENAISLSPAILFDRLLKGYRHKVGSLERQKTEATDMAATLSALLTSVPESRLGVMFESNLDIPRDVAQRLAYGAGDASLRLRELADLIMADTGQGTGSVDT